MNHYMYSAASEKIEVNRLEKLNELHNSHTLQFLTPYLLKNKNLRILELGCGSGHLAAEVMKLVNQMSTYVGIDRDLAQIKNASKTLTQFESRIKLIKLDVLTEFARLKENKPFDLIFCRWFLVHLPNHKRIEILQNTLNLLSENGVFICDECDNKNVKFFSHGNASALYKEATELWLRISKVLMNTLENDLELTPEKICDALKIASSDNGFVNVEGQYQVTLREHQEKQLISDGFRSSQFILETAFKEKSFKDVIKVFDDCAADNNIKINFLTQNVVSYKKSKAC